jgi:hypothetical protein
VVAEYLARRFYADEKLSNPGHTGFSVLIEDLEDFPEVKEFLQDLSDYGNFIMLDHTTKNSDRKRRLKLYFQPIFCPAFGIPYVRTKEPYYASIKDVLSWMHQSVPKTRTSPTDTAVQQELF